MSKEELLKIAREKQYKPEMLEKVYRLLDIFQQIISVDYLKERFVLKGGTALNLFYFDELPRLSVDIDLNYIGQIQREKMLKEKPIVVEAINQILMQNQFERYRSPMRHAGGKMIWFYNSVLGQRGSLEIDINFMYRQPLYPVVYKSAKMEVKNLFHAPVLDIHELAAGKLMALFSRTASRDLFDAHYLLTKIALDLKKLREAFVIYLGMTKIELSSLEPSAITYDLTDLKNRLSPVMHQQKIPRNTQQLKLWAGRMLEELQAGLGKILPLNESEKKFIQKIRLESKLSPELITDDIALSDKVKLHPAILWSMKT